jgi:hypothetical protein
MPKRLLLFVLSGALLASSALPGQPSHSRGSSHTHSYSRNTKTGYFHAPRTKSHSSSARKRSAKAKGEFLRESGYPHGRKGYVVDHRVPLACGGADAPSNMQWQTKAEAKAKDKTERIGCK